MEMKNHTRTHMWRTMVAHASSVRVDMRKMKVESHHRMIYTYLYKGERVVAQFDGPVNVSIISNLFVCFFIYFKNIDKKKINNNIPATTATCRENTHRVAIPK